MTFLQKSRKTRNDKKRILLISLLILLLLNLFFAGDTVKNIVHAVGNPIMTLGQKISSPLSVIPDHFKTKTQLVNENTELIQENKKLKLKLLTVDELRNENDELRSVLGYGKVPSERGIARVLLRPPLSPFDTFVIDYGEEETVVGAEVFYTDILIGHVEEVFSTSSIVRLVSSPDQESFVDIGSDIQTQAKGTGGGSFVVSLPKDVFVEIGNLVSFSNDGIIGPIEAIEIDSISTFQNTYFSFPFSTKEIDWVEVAK